MEITTGNERVESVAMGRDPARFSHACETKKSCRRVSFVNRDVDKFQSRVMKRSCIARESTFHRRDSIEGAMLPSNRTMAARTRTEGNDDEKVQSFSTIASWIFMTLYPFMQWEKSSEERERSIGTFPIKIDHEKSILLEIL